MTRENFSIVQPWVLAHEGGYVNNRKDPGGATNMGIIQRTYDAYRKLIGLARRSVRYITPTERDTIYKTQFWDKVLGDRLPSGVDYAVYDFAVNSGVKRASEYLQRIVGVRQDGIIGMETLAAVEAMPAGEVIERLCRDRIAFMKRIRHRRTNALLWKTFGKGWTRRVMGRWEGVQEGDHGVIDRATMLANKAQLIPAPKILKDGSGARANGPSSFWAGIISALRALFGR
ncbi:MULTISPECIES: glycoside hydrolase family 108 protein [unclassified Sulfitobacter]|jgi:lysozyme family protein|uniref:glycoside hydrolase family 108 protein n=1 Tax=unclassified Sulfitobacter TaxID=196795 RepID=UPI0007C2C1D9|nr:MULTISPECIES: glycoside hydrolase family 108 protein [unclassified Sulfitobacter]KZX98055.1 hypothetical protein A3721_06835 [Sulfitobacter sp. HI0023]